MTAEVLKHGCVDLRLENPWIPGILTTSVSLTVTAGGEQSHEFLGYFAPQVQSGYGFGASGAVRATRCTTFLARMPAPFHYLIKAHVRMLCIRGSVFLLTSTSLGRCQVTSEDSIRE